MSKCSINFQSGTASSAPLVPSTMASGPGGSTAGEINAGKAGGFQHQPMKVGETMAKNCSTLTGTTSTSCTRAEPFMLTSAEKRNFFTLHWDLQCSAMSPTQKQDKVDLTCMPTQEPTQEGLVHGCISLHNTSCKNTHCHSHMEQRFPSFHYHN